MNYRRTDKKKISKYSQYAEIIFSSREEYLEYIKEYNFEINKDIIQKLNLD